MDICMLSELFYPFMSGGAERRYYEIAVRLAKRHDVTMYSLNLDGRSSHEMHRGVKIIRIGMRHPLDKRSLAPLATYWPALVKAAAGRHDVIDANQGIASFMGMLKCVTNKPIVATFHDIYWNQWNDYFRFPFSSMGKAMEFMWSKLDYDRIITVSPNTEKKLKKLGFKPLIEVIPSGVDGEFIKKINASKEKDTVIFVGRLVKYKNVDKLMAAFRRIQDNRPNALLRIIGTGPEEQHLRGLARGLKINVKFHGFVSESEKIRLIKSASVLVNPSSVEGLGLILLESMACRTPVVAKRLDTYFFCNPANSILYGKDEGLADAMESAMTSRQKMVKAGIATSQKFSWDNVASKIENLYERVS